MTISVDLFEALRQLSEADGRPRAGERLVVGFSGGADSVALLDLLDRWCRRGGEDAPGGLVAAHLDHGLRDESPKDAEFCAEFCRRRGIDFVVERCDVRALAASGGLGIEGAGRLARYDFFERVRRQRGADRVATAHHLDDHLETVFLWLGRGSGLSGLVGIEASNDALVRPCRSFRRLELRDYLKHRGLDWREDASNLDRERRRNRVRAELLPIFESIFGSGSARRLAGFSSRAQGERAALRATARRLLDQCRQPGPGPEIVLSRREFLDLEESLQLQVLRELARETAVGGRSQRWNAGHFRRVLRYVVNEGRTGSDLDLPEGGRLALDRQTLTFWPAEAMAQDPASFPPSWVLREDLLPAEAGQVTFLQQASGTARPGGAESTRSATLFEASFDADRIQGPLCLRTLREGDRMEPLGMRGHHKKIRRLLAERSVPRHQRDSQLVVEDTQRVIWAVGVTTCHPARIQASTRSVLRLRVEPELSNATQQGKDPGS